MAAIDDLKTARDNAATQIKTLSLKLSDATQMSGAGYAKTKQDLKQAVDAFKELDLLVQEMGGDSESYMLTDQRLLTS